MLEKMKNLKSSVASRAMRGKKDNDQYLVALDIGTEFIKALIGKVTPNGVEIIGVGRTHQ